MTAALVLLSLSLIGCLGVSMSQDDSTTAAMFAVAAVAPILALVLWSVVL